MRNKELIVIAGPTGVGKTELGIKLALDLKTEIISADSRQIYRELKIGTAAPHSAQLNKVKHHFIHSRSINEYYNASKYENEVLELLKGLFEKHDKVLLLGGTGLYIDAVIKGIDDLPGIDINIREKIYKKLEEEGLETLKLELKKLDPVSYESIDLNNPKRVQKALEVSIQTGKPYSEFLKKIPKKRDFHIRQVALNLDREDLYNRINDRTEKMIAAGWVSEAAQLLPYKSLNALNTVGYKELFAYLEGLYTLDFAIEKIKANTRKYARKQITWFRKDPNYHWYRPDEYEKILKSIKNG